MRRYAASFGGPWTGDDPIVHDAGVVIEVDEPDDDAVHLEDGRFRCAVTAELRSQGAVVALLEATIEGSMRDGRPVDGTGTVRHAR